MRLAETAIALALTSGRERSQIQRPPRPPRPLRSAAGAAPTRSSR